ncbi:MAG TPA: hypothetical protein VFN22_07900 [Gemmatimonadales bacterium]|nr:hypothetical protein [Gemmatimonadales bacterium]
MTDKRDIGTPGEKEWQEFRATVAPFFLMTWLLEEMDHIAPDYFDELEQRFAVGFDDAVGLKADSDDYDGAVPVQLLGSGVIFFDASIAETIYDQLFPDGNSPHGDFRYQAWGSTIVGAHSALESFLRAKGAVIRGGLPNAVTRWFESAEDGSVLTADLMDSLRVLDATRHLLVHNRGVVDDKYIRSVAGTTLESGEFRPIAPNDVRGMLAAAWDVASLVHRSSPKSE